MKLVFIVCDNVCNAKKVSELMKNIIERKYGSDGNYGCNGNNGSNGKKTLIKQRKQRHQNIGKVVAATTE